MTEQQSVLVEVYPGEFAVFGGFDLKGSTIEPAPLLPRAARKSFEDTISGAIGAGNIGAQAMAALGSFEGLVRLSPATLDAMRAGATPMSNGVFNLGSLTDSSGHIVQTVQWTSAGAGLASLPAVAAAVGPALALMAIQMQLAKITRLVRENLQLTDALLEELRTERWATVQGQHEGMLAMIGEARSIGAVNDNIWQNVQGNEMVLQVTRVEFRRNVDRHVSKLNSARGPIAVREILDHHGDAIVADVQGLLQAQAAWFTYQAIRAGNLQFNIDKDPTAAQHIQTVVTNARKHHEQDLADAARLIDALVRRSSAMVDAKGSASIPFGRKRRAAKDVARAGKILRDQLSFLHDGWDLADPPVQVPHIAAVEGGVVPDKVLRVLRWHLRPQEQLHAIAAAQDQSSSRNNWAWKLQDDWLVAAVTNERVIVAKQKDLDASGEVAGEIPLDSVRYVRYEPGTGKPNRSDARIGIATADRDLNLKFAEWATAGTDRRQVDTFALLLRSQMRLPAEEVPVSPIASPHPITAAT
ncbi:hypothetical protein [Phycicoccus sp. Soil802]|uniref:hypothetical protein n=1 Tax=Phycicoccus sp. Soil802 TaxID=1736414 RepID=UPI0007031BDD|nr:hypothetical protein [Phycicoccus sp. Soil802]KRF29486.1 hypothetical protein ASG91_00155 [Phycicoccus sp. Soil802]